MSEPQPNQLQLQISAWDQVADYARLAARFAHASLACQAMAGLLLIELKKNFARRPGRPSSGSTMELDWEDACFDAGISPTTAWRWMKLAESIKPRLRRLGAAERLQELIGTPPSSWSHDDAEQMFRALEKITDGRTQLQFLAEIGLAKRMPGAPESKSNNPPSRDPIPHGLDMAQIAARDWGEIQKLIEAYDSARLFSFLDASLIQAQCAVLEAALKARRNHLEK